MYKKFRRCPGSLYAFNLRPLSRRKKTLNTLFWCLYFYFEQVFKTVSLLFRNWFFPEESIKLLTIDSSYFNWNCLMKRLNLTTYNFTKQQNKSSYIFVLVLFYFLHLHNQIKGRAISNYGTTSNRL